MLEMDVEYVPHVVLIEIVEEKYMTLETFTSLKPRVENMRE
jgi:hypothetical protein